MGIPDSIKEKLDSDPSWVIQHEDIVRVMDETHTEKPWSRYMIQQHLEGDPAKKTVQDRLDELVEIDVLKRYEYSNQTLYDLAYDPLVTDGGRLKDANIIELATFQDRKGIRDLGTGAMLISFVFFGIAIISDFTSFGITLSLSGNLYFDTAIVLYLFSLLVLLLITLVEKIEKHLPDSTSS